MNTRNSLMLTWLFSLSIYKKYSQVLCAELSECKIVSYFKLVGYNAAYLMFLEHNATPLQIFRVHFMFMVPCIIIYSMK